MIVSIEGCATRHPPQLPTATPPAPAGTPFTLTAYCRGTKTAAGTKVTGGIVAADPGVLPIGSVVRIFGVDARYDGVYTVLDTGKKVRGRLIDVYVKDCSEAVRFGRRTAQVATLRKGWDPRSQSQ